MSFDLKLENGTINFGSNGDLKIVRDSEKLEQDLLKICMTQIGSNKKFPWYGSPISQSMIGRAFDTIFIQSVGSNQLRFAITNLQRLQLQQLSSDQMVTPQEQIASIEGVRVDQNQIDPRFFNIDISVLSKAFRRVRAQFSASV